MTNQEVLPHQFKFSGKKIECFFDADFSMLEEKIQKDSTVFITDENIFSAHGEKFSGWQTIVIKERDQCTIVGITSNFYNVSSFL